MNRFIRTLLLGLAVNVAASFGATVSGTITDSTSSEKLADVAIALRLDNQTVKRDTTGADGTYSFADVAAGNYVVRATKTGYVVKNAPDTVTAEETESKTDIAIAKTVTTTVAGTVTDSSAATALANVIVQLRNATGTPVATDTTDAEGKYSFANVVTGEYTVRATISGYATKSAPASVTSSTAVTADVALAIVILSSITGTVTDSAAGTALKSAIVTLRSSGKNAIDTTDSIGGYSFADVPTGVCSLSVTLAKYTTKIVGITLASATPDTENIQLVLTVTTTVSGTITDSAAGTALAKVAVALRKDNRSVAYDTTGDDGKYSFADVPVGEYTIRATLDGYRQTSVLASAPTSTAVTVDVKMPVIPTTTVSGTVTDSAAGTALAGAAVRLQSGARTLYDTTGADGKYSFEKIQLGTFSVRGSLTGYTSKTIADSITDATAKTVDLPLATVKYGTIEGIVTADSLTGAAIEGVSVVLSKTGSGMGTPVDTVTTDAQGKYLFEKIESTLAYSIRGSKSGFTSKSATLASKSAETDKVDFFLATIITKNVTVIVRKAADSTAIAGAGITFAQSGSITGPSMAATDATGKAVFEKIVQGTYTASSFLDGFTPAAVSYTLSAASPDSVVIYLAAAATKTITGTVTDSLKATAIAGAVVSVRISGATGSPTITIAAKTDESGAYILTGIPAANSSVNLSASLAEYRSFTKAQLTVGTANTADTTKFDFRMLPTSAGVVDHSPEQRSIRQPAIRLSRNGTVSLVNFNGAIDVSVFDLNGRAVYRSTFNTTANSPIDLGSSIRLSDAQYIVHVASENREIMSRSVTIYR